MKFLKFTISTLIILLMLFFLVLPVGIGLWIERNYNKIINDIPASPNVSVKLGKYQLGWFHSKATIIVDFHANNSRLIVNSNINQGPLIFTKTSSGSQKMQFALAKINTRIPSINFNLTSLWDFNNKIVSEFSSDHLKINTSNLNIRAKGVEGISTTNLKHNKWNTTIGIDSGSVATQTTANENTQLLASFNDFAYSGNMQLTGSINYGKQELSFSNITLMPAEPAKKTVIKNILLTSNVSHDNGSTNMQVIIDAKNIDNKSADINALMLDLSLDGLNTKLLDKLFRVAQQQNNNANISKLLSASNAVLQSGLSLKLNQFYFGTTQGKVSAKGEINIPPTNADAKFSQLITLATANINLQVPKVWLTQQLTKFFELKQKNQKTTKMTPTASNNSNNPTNTPPSSTNNPASTTDNSSSNSINTTTPTPPSPHDLAVKTIQEWESKRYLIANGNNYTINVSFREGKLFINGKHHDLKQALP